jgi:hypothetical protein
MQMQKGIQSMPSRKNRRRKSILGPREVGSRTLPSERRACGIQEMLESYEEHRKELGLTPKQYEEKQALIRQMFGHLYFFHGDPTRLFWHVVCRDAAPFASRARIKYYEAFERSSDSREKEDLTVAIAGSVLLEEFWIAEKVPLSKGKEASTKELCGSCNDRIRRRYLQPSDEKLTGGPIRMTFHTGYKARSRSKRARAAWECANKAGLPRDEFVAEASEILRVDRESIRRYLKDAPAKRRSRKARH